MPKTIRYTLLSIRDLMFSIGPFLALAVLLLVLAYLWLDPNPPKRVILATGPAQSAYDEFGKRYAKTLAANGIEVVLLPSEGSSANLQLLREGKADLGFVQGGSNAANNGAADPTSAGSGNLDTNEGIESLGSLFVEPVWLFYREEAAKLVLAQEEATKAKNAAAAGTPPKPTPVPAPTPAPTTSSTTVAPGPVLSSLPQLQGLRVNIGTAGSGVPNLMTKLLEVNHVDISTLKLSRLEQTPATVAFLSGELDAIVFASAPESLMVQMLLQTPGVKLMNFPQSEAYSRRFAFLTPVLLPRGVVDLAGDIPSRDVRLVASTTALLTRDTTHPALVQLFSQAAQNIHSSAGWFNRAREFPNINNSEYTISKEADRNIKFGPPLLQRYLPFWIANLIERMWLVLGIIVAVLLPLSRIIPPLYEFRIRSRVFRWYRQLREIENRQESEPGSSNALLTELNDLEERVSQINVPLSYTDELYALRNNIHLVRRRLQRV